ncbi:MAG: hypothetical protein ACK4IK_04945 [Bacteroidia bacterium]
MKKSLLIILLSSFLITSTELHEMFKISSLIEHYFEHKQNDKNLDIFDFIALHYSNENHFDGHENKLPFKTQHDLNFIAKLFKVNFSKQFFNYTLSIKHLNKAFVINNEQKKSSLFIHTIWQPPKF